MTERRPTGRPMGIRIIPRRTGAPPDIKLAEEFIDRLNPYLVTFDERQAERVTNSHTRNEGRVLSVSQCLSMLVLSLKEQKPIDEFQRLGGLEVIDFLEALEDGNSHPLLERWEILRKKAASHPAPTTRTIELRRQVAVCSLALQDGKGIHRVPKWRARVMAAEVAAESGAFISGCTSEMVRNWERNFKDDESVIRDVDILNSDNYPSALDVCARCIWGLQLVGMPPTHVKWCPPPGKKD